MTNVSYDEAVVDEVATEITKTLAKLQKKKPVSVLETILAFYQVAVFMQDRYEEEAEAKK